MASRPPARPPGRPILIAGGGPASLCLALAVARAAGPAAAITVADPAFARRARDGRAFALSPAALAALEGLGLGSGLAGGLQPIHAMTITDGRAADRIRSERLGFQGEDGPLGYMVEAERLAEALRASCGAAGVTLTADEVVAFAAGEPGSSLTVETRGGASLRAALLVAADGAQSRIREAAGIGWIERPYRQLGIVGTVAHPLDHRGVATQHFLPGGPLAILPLARAAGEAGFRSSIVWTEEAGEARRVLASPPGEQEARLRALFGPERGDPSLATALHGFPLAAGLARRFVGRRLALLGDAAHQIHPLAGQGLNLGIADAAALAEHVVDALRLGLDPGGDQVLSAYERDRRVDAVALAGFTDLLNRLFSNDVLPIRALRDLGLALVDRNGAAKGFFAREAAGRTARAPRLMRGEAL